MNTRKKHVINIAHQLFIDKGFQNTSLQDILDYSGISKGTFYNYFSSKNELLIELLTIIFKKMEMDRNELLIGQDLSNIDIFIKQVELKMTTYRANKLFTLFEEIFVDNDEELKKLIKKVQLKSLKWTYQRFIDIFGEERKPYLLDCAIMFTGILHQNIRYNALAYGIQGNTYQIVRYSVERMVRIVHEVSETAVQLISPDILEKWLPGEIEDQFNRKPLLTIMSSLRKSVTNTKQTELLDFIQDEFFHSKKPRKFVIESALETLKEELKDKCEFTELEKIVTQLL